MSVSRWRLPAGPERGALSLPEPNDGYTIQSPVSPLGLVRSLHCQEEQRGPGCGRAGVVITDRQQRVRLGVWPDIPSHHDAFAAHELYRFMDQ